MIKKIPENNFMQNNSSYDYDQALQSLWEKALDLYKQSKFNPNAYFSPNELGVLAASGLSAQNVYDHVEDFTKYGEPTFSTFLLVASVRRNYFLSIQKGMPSSGRVAMDDLPAKSESYEGTPWLPRILKKAQVYLMGELDSAVMYGCAGDRLFLKEHKVHPADFLRVVWDLHFDIASVHSWLLSQKSFVSAI